MRKFRYPLDRLLRLRAHQERAARRSLAEVAAHARRLDEQLAVVGSNRSLCEGERGPAAALAQALVDGFGRLQARLTVERREVEVSLEQRRVDYGERRRDREGLSRLRDRRREQWRVDSEREEQREFDELALRRFIAARAEREAQ